MLPATGVDISKQTFHVELSNNNKLRHRKFVNSAAGHAEFAAWLKKHRAAPAHVCLEATGPYGEELALYLYQQGHTVSVVNPARIKAFAASELQRNKDDRPDAGVIRRFCETQRPPDWTPPPAALRELQALTRYLEHLQDTRQQHVNRLGSTTAKTIVGSLRKLVASLDREIARTEKQIRNHINNDPELKRQCELLQTIPGVAERTAAKLLAEMQNLAHYKSARQAAAYAGVTPRNIRSGKFRGKTRMSKIGNARVRKALFMPAMTAKKYNPVLRAFAQRLALKGKTKMAITGAVMRKLIHIVFGVIKTGLPFDPNYEREHCHS
jgi:transposase